MPDGADAAAARVLAGGADRGSLHTDMNVKIDDLRSEMPHGFATVHTGLAQISALIRSIEQRGDG